MPLSTTLRPSTEAVIDVTAGIKAFNAQKNGVTAKLLEFSTSADEQRQQFVQRQEAKSGECDVFSSDVIWTAEFASQKWLYDLTPYIDTRRSELIEATLDTATFDGKVWGMPQQTDAGFLYYRTDQVKQKPTTWQHVYADADSKDGIVYQGAPYEGLTCNFVELSSAAGGTILSEDGKKAEFDSPENLKALKLMVDGMKTGGAVKASRTFMEEPARMAFEAGKATFMRNWSYAYALAKKAKKTKDVVEVSPLPPFEGGGKGGVLGGNGPVVSAFTDNPEASLLWLDYWTSEETLKRDAIEYSLPPTMPQLYDDPAVVKTMPYAKELRTAVENATSRPVSPVYSQISQAVFTNVNKAIGGQMSPEDALKKGQEQIETALSSF